MIWIATRGSAETIALSMALDMSFSNLGIFVALGLTNLASTVMKSNLAKDRILFTVICLVLIYGMFYLLQLIDGTDIKKHFKMNWILLFILNFKSL